MSLSTLPTHPRTGLRALGWSRRGPIWPIRGGSVDTPPGDPANPDPKADPPKGDPKENDTPLGEAGKKALDAERARANDAEKQVRSLQSQIDTLTQQLADVKNDGLPEWQQQINELQTKLDTEIDARSKAEQTAATATLLQKRTDRAIDKGLSATAAKKLAPALQGTSDEDIDAEIDDWLPLLDNGSGPLPNPQQGNPSKGRGGTLSAGRERYADTHK